MPNWLVLSIRRRCDSVPRWTVLPWCGQHQAEAVLPRHLHSIAHTVELYLVPDGPHLPRVVDDGAVDLPRWFCMRITRTPAASNRVPSRAFLHCWHVHLGTRDGRISCRSSAIIAAERACQRKRSSYISPSPGADNTAAADEVPPRHVLFGWRGAQCHNGVVAVQPDEDDQGCGLSFDHGHIQHESAHWPRPVGHWPYCAPNARPPRATDVHRRHVLQNWLSSGGWLWRRSDRSRWQRSMLSRPLLPPGVVVANASPAW